uniref:Uncharacterized protein n=1 Tax=Caenorhabditis japonica TaxID=281687 RepID=A0A8R1DJT0_CAEJA
MLEKRLIAIEKEILRFQLCEPDDRALLFHLLSREISTGNYDDPLTICRNLASNLDDLFFSRLLMQILRDEKRKRIDPHMILCWLETGDCLFSGNSTTISTKNYAILKLYYLCKNWKSKIECFSCGCVQKISVDLFLNNNCTRLNEALLSIVKSDFSNVDPTIRRLLHSFSDVRPIELFSYYIELLAEFHECALIEDLSGENAPARLIQLTGLLCEMKTDDIPEACSRVNRLLGQTSSAPQSGKKSSAAIETVLKCKLVPKIFECLMVMDSDSGKLENFSKRESVQRFSVLVEKESYSISQQASIFFAPLQLLLFLYKSEFFAGPQWLSVLTSLA